VAGFIKGFVKAAFNNQQEDGHHTWFGSAWGSANRHAGNDAKLWAGLFTADTRQSGWGWQILSKWTWEGLQTFGGFLTAQTFNMTSQINHVDNSKYGVSVIDCEYFNDRGAMTIGSYMMGPRGYRADYHDHLFVHEFGHTLQSKDWGLFYLSLIALPSITSGKWSDNHNDPYGTKYHDFRWFEVDANQRGADFFGNYADFNKDNFETGKKPTYINPRTQNYNTSAYPLNAKFDWSDLLINCPGVNLMYDIFF